MLPIDRQQLRSIKKERMGHKTQYTIRVGKWNLRWTWSQVIVATHFLHQLTVAWIHIHQAGPNLFIASAKQLIANFERSRNGKNDCSLSVPGMLCVGRTQVSYFNSPPCWFICTRLAAWHNLQPVGIENESAWQVLRTGRCDSPSQSTCLGFGLRLEK